MPGYYEPTEPSFTYDDWRAERDAEEGARQHGAEQANRIAADEDVDADIPF